MKKTILPFLVFLPFFCLTLSSLANSPQENINFNIQYESNGQTYTFPTTYDIDDYVVGNMVGVDDYVELRYLGYDGAGREYVVYISQYNGGGSYWVEMMFPINEAGDLGNVYYDGPSLFELTRAHRPWDMGPEAPLPNSLNFDDWMGDVQAYATLQSRGIFIEQPQITASSSVFAEEARDLNVGLLFEDGSWIPE